MSGWGCPHEFQGRCMRVEQRPCDPGMKGCILFGRFNFSNTEKNRPGGPRRRGHPSAPDKDDGHGGAS